MYLRLIKVVDSNYCPFVGIALFLIFAMYQTILQCKVYWFDPENNLVGWGLFNRGRLLNSAFDHVTRNDQSDYGDPYDCIVIHDVDLLPTSPQHQPYHCSPDSPLHLSTAIDEMRFNLLYPQLMGGVVSFTPWQFVRINGFSNLYDGWGAEDDDVAMRYHLLSLWRRWPFEGLNTIRMRKAKMATNVSPEEAETDSKGYSLDSRIERNYVHLSVTFQ